MFQKIFLLSISSTLAKLIINHDLWHIICKFTFFDMLLFPTFMIWLTTSASLHLLFYFFEIHLIKVCHCTQMLIFVDHVKLFTTLTLKLLLVRLLNSWYIALFIRLTNNVHVHSVLKIRNASSCELLFQKLELLPFLYAELKWFWLNDHLSND
jgi:hypothetical protein